MQSKFLSLGPDGVETRPETRIKRMNEEEGKEGNGSFILLGRSVGTWDCYYLNK